MVQRLRGAIKSFWKQWARLHHIANVLAPLNCAAGTVEMAVFMRLILYLDFVKVLWLASPSILHAHQNDKLSTLSLSR